VSQNTRASYKETLKIFTLWLSKRLKKREITLSDISIQDILEFLNHLEDERGNAARTRNQRLACLKKFFNAAQLFAQNDGEEKICKQILCLPKKRYQKTLIDFYEHTEAIKILNAIDRSNPLGFRDFVILNLLYNTGMRATEIATLKLQYYNREKQEIEIIGKGNKWRVVPLWPKNAHLLDIYIKQQRTTPKPIYRDFLFISQRGEPLTRFGIHKICKKYNDKVPKLKKRYFHVKRNPCHSWRHTAAIYMISLGCSITEVQIRLGHVHQDTTTQYLKHALSIKRESLQAFIKYIKDTITIVPQAEIDWSNEKDLLEKLKSL